MLLKGRSNSKRIQALLVAIVFATTLQWVSFRSLDSPEMATYAGSKPTNIGNNKEIPTKSSLLLPLPILVVGLPKAGTSSIGTFFQRAGFNSSHYKCVNNLLCGLCINTAVKAKKPPLLTCGGYDVWAQMDVENLGQCHFPQIEDLDALHEEVPEATLILNTRNLTRWVKSVKNWLGDRGSMAMRLAKCSVGPASKQPQDLMDWHLAHLQRIRDFVKLHPSHTLVEVDVEDPQAGHVLATAFGPPTLPEFWGRENDSVGKAASKTTNRDE
eukprot:Nitzschia sp. Nitz4//scaffold45_size130396//75938//76747//NITZ4_003457-RA/size130396-processed-gene-0.104-mRNA-1//-1//CDS//3329552422//5414//frame0